MLTDSATLVPLAAVPDAAIDALLDAAFGPDRRTRTAYHIRTGTKPLAQLSFALVEAEMPIATIQCWPVALESDLGAVYPLVMIGPVAVLPHRQRDGLGRKLMVHMLEAAANGGQDKALMLIGDPEYYGRFFGFSAERTAKWRAPGPVEARRLLARGTLVPQVAGLLRPRPPLAG